MSFLRVLSIILFLVLALYTAIVIANDGVNLLPVYFTDLFSLTWTGQFVLDFSSYLLLSALWIVWRHQFTPAGIALAVVAGIGGMLIFSIYLIVAIGRAKGDMAVLLLGPQRSRR